MPKIANYVFETVAFPQSTNNGGEAASGEIETIFDVLRFQGSCLIDFLCDYGGILVSRISFVLLKMWGSSFPERNQYICNKYQILFF